MKTKSIKIGDILSGLNAILPSISMASDYDIRKLERYIEGDLFISTAFVSDTEHPYETAVAHPKYNNEKIVIVEEYDTRDDALKGHNKWIKIMTAEKLPEELKDVSTSAIAKLCNG